MPKKKNIKNTSYRPSKLVMTVAILGSLMIIFATVQATVNGNLLRGDSNTTAHASSSIPNYDNALADATWMMQATINSGSMNGAIATYIDQQHIRPYQANLAALGLARASQISGNLTYVNAVWSHLNWYQNHMDASNYVHDWDLINGVWTQAPNSISSGPYDSTDSYAATYLLAVRAAYNADPQLAKLSILHTGITKAVAAIHATQQADGLTWATPTYHGKLTEDNAETYQGLLAGRDMLKTLGDTTAANNANAYAIALYSGFESLWLPSNNAYGVQKSENGVVVPPNWQNLSPDVMAQGWTVAWKLASLSRGTSLLSQITTNKPNWDQPNLNGNNYDVAPIGWGYYYVGDTNRAQQSATNLRNAALATNRAWPYNTMAAGEIIITETEGENFIFQLVTTPTPSPTVTPKPSPTPTPTPTPKLTNGVMGAYFNNVSLSGNPAVSKIDTNINFSWGTKAPATGINKDNFSVRWTGFLRAPATGSYQICTQSDDGSRLWINNVKLVDRWFNNLQTKYCGTIALQANTNYPLTYEYYDSTTTATAIVLWTIPASTKNVVIPATNLFH